MAVAVGGTNGLIDELLTLLGWRATSTVADQERKDALAALNVAEQLVAQSESLYYLQERRALSLPAGQSYVAVPEDIDYGKDMTFSPANGEGVIEYRSWDKFAAIRSISGYAITSSPAYYSLAIDQATGELRFWFKPGNATANPISVVLVAQAIPPALTDAVDSYSMLPDGYERTLLLPIAEEYCKSQRNEFGLEKLTAELRSRLGEFYNKQRPSKTKPATDRGRERRKVDVTVAEEGY